MFYYEVYVNIPEGGYSFGIQSEIDLNDDEVLNIARIEKKFQEEWDDEYAEIEEITEEEFNEYFTN